MKLCVALSALLIGLSASYYFLFTLPKVAQQRLAAETAKQNWQHGQECSSKAEHFFAESSWSDKKSGASYENHFNRKLNRCFVFVRSTASWGAGGLSLYKVLMDASDGTTIAQYDKQVPYGTAEYAVKPLICEMGESFCKSEEEFSEFVKPYMQE